MEDYKVLQTGDEIQEILNQAPVDTADIAEMKEAATSLDGRLEAVEGKIPSGASSENPLTDKQYVDSSIASASATFRGTYNEVTDLELTTDATHADIGSALDEVIELADSNDYCFVQIPTDDETPMEIDSIERYKFVTGTGWEYEYTLNNSGFTAGQWAAINSGITSGLVTKLTDLPTNAELENLLNGKANATDVYTKSETYNKTELDSMITTPDVQYVSVTATAQTTAVTDVLPSTGAADTVYRVGSWDGTQYNANSYSEYAWNGSSYVLLNVKETGIATGSDFDNPTPAQRELVTTVGSVLDGISEGVFDLTAKTGDSYATLADALTAANTAIPTNKKRGGMSIKFVQSSDNKYVQYRYMSSSTATADFTNVANWQGVDNEPVAGSNNLVKSGGVEKYLASKTVLTPSAVGIEVGGMVINGSVVTFDSTKTAYRTYGRASNKRIHLLEGDTIYLSNLGTPTIGSGYSAFTKVVTNNDIDSYECLVQGKGVPAQYIYKATEEMDIIVCSQGTTMTVSRLMEVATKQSLEYLGEYVNNNTVRVNEIQDFTESQKNRALNNIGISGIGGGIEENNENITKSEEVFDEFKGEEEKISQIREFLGNQETVEYGKYDYCGIYFNGTDAFVAATSRFDGLIIKVFNGVTYNIGNINNARLLTNLPVIGTDIGSNVNLPYTANKDGYLLVTVEKANAPFTLTKGIDGFYKDYIGIKNRVGDIGSVISSILDTNITKLSNRVNQAIYLGNGTKEMEFTCKVISGTDTGRYRLYNTGGTSIGTALTDWINLGDSIIINIPSNGYVWLFTETVLTSSVVYNVYAELTDSINRKVENLSEVVNSVDFEVNGTVANVNITKSAYRVNQALYIGHAGEKVKMYFNLVSGVDTEGWAVYGTNEAGSAIDVNVVLVDYNNTTYGVPEEFVVPSNGYVWLFTEFNPSSSNARTYNVVVALMTSLVERVGDIESEVKPFAGKTIVCFGDSITEFKGTDQKRYSDWLEEMLGATVINVGIGGTQIRQRTTPSVTPSGSNQCYAGLDMVNLVKAAMEQDFTIARASAQELARISADDNTAIVERLAAIDWSKVDIVTFLAGTNDWTGNVGNSGNIDSTDINETCGAMNNIISKICSTHKNIKVYWFTPIIRYVDPADFSTATSYSIGDLCAYSGAYYRFVNAHQGAWNAEDVEQITKAECRIPELFSDNKVLYGKNLREFCSLLESVAVKNHIPVLNTYNTLGWNQYNFSNFFPIYDNTHPYIGFKSLAEKLSKFLIAN